MTQVIEIWQPSNGINIDYSLYQVSVDETYNFNFTGTINIENLTVNGTLSATLPLSSNGSINISGNDISLNLANANTWTAEQSFNNLVIGSQQTIEWTNASGLNTIMVQYSDRFSIHPDAANGNWFQIQPYNSSGTVFAAYYDTGVVITRDNTLDDGSGGSDWSGLATFNGSAVSNLFDANQNNALGHVIGGEAIISLYGHAQGQSGIINNYTIGISSNTMEFMTGDNFNFWQGGLSSATTPSFTIGGASNGSGTLHLVKTFNNTLDDGSSGYMSIAGGLTIGGRTTFSTAPIVNITEYDNYALNLTVGSGGTYVIGGGTQCSTGNNGEISFHIMLVQNTYNGAFFKLTIYGGSGSVVGTGIVNGGYSSVASANMYDFSGRTGTLGYYCLIQGKISGLSAYQAYQFVLTNQYSQSVEINSINAVFTGA